MKLTKERVDGLRSTVVHGLKCLPKSITDLCDDHKDMRKMLEELLGYIGTTCRCQPDHGWRCMSCKIKEVLE